ncbi:UNKNOWN [Stylonychia lemnae]|uniref:Uncharacterized protein n=1 Tax=Stylonychia lemnae TaxID=5949 RepID=A0A078AKB7_STYLE|nr:UNKNOWN [Stylonychia lemnae]|eukprot:CDW81253.1 UNKNOWN [Stylonychia lemnae]
MNRINSNVDLELTKLKTLRKRIKLIHQRQLTDLVNSYKKGKEGSPNKGDRNNGDTSQGLKSRGMTGSKSREQEDYADFLDPKWLQIKTPSDNQRFRSTANSSALTPMRMIQKAITKGAGNDEQMQSFIEQSIMQSKKKEKTINNWSKIKDRNSNYHMYKKGFQHLLKEIQESTQNLSKIRGGTSIYEDSGLKEVISSESNAPILQDRRLKANIRNIIASSPTECIFQRVLTTNNNQSVQNSAQNTITDRPIIVQQYTLSQSNTASISNINQSQILKNDSVLFKERDAQISAQRLKKNFKDLMFPSNPALFVQKGGGLINFSHQNKSHLSSGFSSRRNISRLQSPSPETVQNFDELRAGLSKLEQISKRVLNQQHQTEPQLSFMKDYCKKEQVFFNENDRIQYLKQKSKSNFSFYKKTFENTANILFDGKKDNLTSLTDREIQQQIAKLEPSSITQKLKQLKISAKEADLSGISKLNSVNLGPKKETENKFNFHNQQQIKLEPIAENKQQLIRAEFEKFSKILDSTKIIPAKKHRKRRSSPDPINKLSRTLQKYKNQREKSEQVLIRTMEKVKLDKAILFREKLDTIWKDQLYQTDFDAIKYDLLKSKTKRKDLYLKQVENYNTLLKFLKEREVLPVAEEKQILDALKIVLDNQWILGEKELLQIFDLVGLNEGRVKIDVDNLSFLEFIYLIAKLYEIDMKLIQDYFLHKDIN